jgi:hypothetical protein
MPVIVSICLVVTTAALVALAIVTIRAMLRFENMAEQIERTALLFSESMVDVKLATRELHELACSLDIAVQPVREAAIRLGEIGNRAADLSTGVLDELETPLRTVLGVYQGIRTGFTRIADRFHAHRAHDGHG